MSLKVAALKVSVSAVAVRPRLGDHVTKGVPLEILKTRSRDPAAYTLVALVDARTTHSPIPLNVRAPVAESTLQELFVLLTLVNPIGVEPKALAALGVEGDDKVVTVVDGFHVITCAANEIANVTSVLAVK